MLFGNRVSSLTQRTCCSSHIMNAIRTRISVGFGQYHCILHYETSKYHRWHFGQRKVQKTGNSGVLLSAGIELILLPAVSVLWICARRVLITLLVSVVAMKSRTLSQFLLFSYWTGVQELGGSTARQIAQAG